MSTSANSRMHVHMHAQCGDNVVMLPAGILAHHLAWLAMLGHTPDTIYARRRALARMSALIAAPLLSATAADLMAWRAGLDLTPDSLTHYVSHARMFYTWAVGEGLRADNPAGELPVPRVPRRLPRPISEDDLALAVEMAPPRVRPWLVLAAWCGLRAKEIALLRVENITPAAILVAADATKGNRRERIIDISKAGFVQAELAAAGLPGSGYAFRRADRRRGPNAPSTVSHIANKHLHSCGVSATLHQLRHRFGTGTYQATRDLRLVQDLLGHASVTSTQIYADWNRTGAAAAVAALPVPPHLRATG